MDSALETCGLGATLVDVDRQCSLWLAYGPDGGLVCRDRCTAERMAVCCQIVREPPEDDE